MTAAVNLIKTGSLIDSGKPARVLRILKSQTSYGSLCEDIRRIGPRYMSSQAKRPRTENMTAQKIGTHNGTFHCDEVLACFFLRQLPQYKVGLGQTIVQGCQDGCQDAFGPSSSIA